MPKLAISRFIAEPRNQAESYVDESLWVLSDRMHVPLKLLRGLNNREHYMARAKRVKRERECFLWSTLGHQKPTLPVLFRFTRLLGTGNRRLDSDNLAGAFKAVRDAAASWLAIDDASADIFWRYDQAREPSRPGVLIEIFQLRGNP